MSTTSFGVQKASFMANWTVLVDNYMARKLDDKLDSLEKTLSWMLQTVTTLRRQAIVTRNNKRKKNCNEKEIGDTVSQSPQQTLSSLHPSLHPFGACSHRSNTSCKNHVVVKMLLRHQFRIFFLNRGQLLLMKSGRTRWGCLWMLWTICCVK